MEKNCVLDLYFPFQPNKYLECITPICNLYLNLFFFLTATQKISDFSLQQLNRTMRIPAFPGTLNVYLLELIRATTTFYFLH